MTTSCGIKAFAFLFRTALKERWVMHGHNSLVMHAVIGMNSKVGDWTRVEGTPNDPNPNKPFAKTDNHPLFNQEGKLNPSITIVGKFFFMRISLNN